MSIIIIINIIINMIITESFSLGLLLSFRAVAAATCVTLC